MMANRQTCLWCRAGIRNPRMTLPSWLCPHHKLTRKAMLQAEARAARGPEEKKP